MGVPYYLTEEVKEELTFLFYHKVLDQGEYPSLKELLDLLDQEKPVIMDN